MASVAMPSRGIALRGAPDGDIGTKGAKSNAVQVMQLDMTQDIVDELLESVRNGNPPQILFGRTPQLKYGDRSHVLQTASESFRYELYRSGSSGSEDDLTFAGLINHSLAVQKAEEATAGVDSALEQLKNSMAAISEMKEANKTIVGDASPMPTPSHRRFPSKSFSHLRPSSSISSPLRSTPSSPALMALSNMKSAPTSQPSSAMFDNLRALRLPLIHLLAMEPRQLDWLQRTTHGKLNEVKEILGKIAKPPREGSSWQLTDKAYKELDPWMFPYKTAEDRQKAIDNAIKAFDRLRLEKDDKLWQILLPKKERNQGKVLSRLNVQAPAQKSGAPMQKISKLTEKKAGAGGKADEKESEKEGRKVKDAKEKKPVKGGDDAVKKVKEVKNTKKATAKGNPPQAEPTISKARAKKATTAADPSSTPRQKPKAAMKDALQKEKATKAVKPAVNPNTKPKNPSPLSASLPVNASDLEDSHPVRKASPAKASSSGNSDRNMKRKANDIDDSVHNHNLSVKQRKLDRPTPTSTPLGAGAGAKTSTPSSAQSLKRKDRDFDADISRTHMPNGITAHTNSASKHRKIESIDTVAANPKNNPNGSNSSSSPQSDSTTSPMLQLSFRQTVELSQKFQRYYKRYEELYWQLYEADVPPDEKRRDELMRMHRKLEEMKREIKAGARAGAGKV
ncbi:hypothetical protein K432DRAFT_304011 [Lepidopterella palustris CBS 459.81]|uniref:Uncharacterized protein n=1 Tax=Lepidopterella palustris CBS 459.81 TaxID=1314670 RepID=A0A8E2JD06_9PEZI|nr:hypothetical protein K432DRAFT_304011 [Lepidopterella palustris CBS 459.81]